MAAAEWSPVIVAAVDRADTRLAAPLEGCELRSDQAMVDSLRDIGGAPPEQLVALAATISKEILVRVAEGVEVEPALRGTFLKALLIGYELAQRP